MVVALIYEALFACTWAAQENNKQKYENNKQKYNI